MWRAALHASRAVATLAAFTIVTLAALALFAGAADARSKATAATDLPGALWGLEVDRRDVRRLGNRTLRRLRANGTNALIVERGSLRRSQLARLRRRAARQGLAVYVPFLEARPSSRRTADAATGRCRKLEVARPGSRCAVQARSRSSALRIARSGVADVVVVNVSGPGALRRLRGSHERIVAVARLGSRFRAGSWRRGLRAARGYDTVDLAVSWSRPRSLNRYLRLQDRFSRSRDEHAPTAPGRLEVAETLESSLSVTWRRSRDSKTVAGYGLYRGGEHLRDVAGTTATFKDLSCGRKYVFEVDAYDAHGNRSPKTAIRRSTATCAAGLVAAYSFDESGGGTVRDSAGGDDPGTLSGAARTSGRFGRALRFDGENDLVSIPDASRLDLTDKMTLEAWVKPSALGSSWRTVILKEQPDDLVYGLYANATGAAPSGHVYVGDDMRTKGMETLPVGAWTHLAATYDGSMLRLFVNGVESSNLAVDGRMASSSAPLRLGGNQVWDEWFDGVIDEVRIYSRALSPAEIQADMTTAVGEGTPADAEPPSSPSGLAVSAVTDSSLTLSWSSSSDNVAVSGYGLYRNGVSAGTTTLTSRTFTGLACGTAYTFAVDAYDAAGNRSAQASAAGTTLACPPPDTEAPTVPGAVAVTAVTDSSLTLSWSSSSDNVAVAGYGLYRDGASAGTTTLTSRTFGGLACGTTYTLAVDAYDAAGNRSGQASASGQTNPCSSSSGTLYVSTGGSDSNPCTQSAPCQSFNRAYRQAEPGEFVQVAGGTYPGQGIEVHSIKTSTSDVVFRPAPGATVRTTGDVDVYGRHVEFRDMRFGGWYVHPGADDVTFRNVDVHGLVFITSASNVNVFGGEIEMEGTYVSGDSQIKSRTSSSPPPTDILFDGVYMHDFLRAPGSGDHIECLQVGSGVNVTIRNSRFNVCSTHDVFIRSWGDGYPLLNWTFENNFFGTTTEGFYSLKFKGDLNPSECGGFVVRNNSATQSMLGESCPGSIRWIGNLAPKSNGCYGTSFSYNVWYSSSAERCGSTDRLVATPGFVNEVGFDLHLRPTSPAVDAGSPSDFPARDIDGQSRPLGGRADAGADEAG